MEKLIQSAREGHRPPIEENAPLETETSSDTEIIMEPQALPPWLPSSFVTNIDPNNPLSIDPVTTICSALVEALHPTEATTLSAIPEDPNSTITAEDAETPTVGDIDTSPPIAVKRGQQQLNNFTENDRLFYWSFSFVFLLGHG